VTFHVRKSLVERSVGNAWWPRLSEMYLGCCESSIEWIFNCSYGGWSLDQPSQAFPIGRPRRAQDAAKYGFFVQDGVVGARLENYEGVDQMGPTAIIGHTI